MAEKEIPLASTPFQDQNLKHVPKDEISLLDLLIFLVRKKWLILSTVSIFFVLSIFYAFSDTLIYRAKIGFQQPEKKLTSFYPDIIHDIIPKYSGSVNGIRDINGIFMIKNSYMLNKLVLELQSYSNQEKVFMEGKFHERFVANNPGIDIKKGIVQEIHSSIYERIQGMHLSRTNNELLQETLAHKVLHYDMKGVNPELASDYLNALADWVKNKVEVDIKESIQKGVKDRIALLSAQLNNMITRDNNVEQLKYDDKIRVLTDNIEIAKNLGILGNNFANFKPAGLTFQEKEKITHPDGTVTSSVVDRIKVKAAIDWPVWYLYGQRALENELNLMERRGVSSQYAKETYELIFKIKKLSSIDLSKIIFDPVIISMPSITPVDPINRKKVWIVATGIVIGLFLGILMALLSCLMTYLKERSKLYP